MLIYVLPHKSRTCDQSETTGDNVIDISMLNVDSLNQIQHSLCTYRIAYHIIFCGIFLSTVYVDNFFSLKKKK